MGKKQGWAGLLPRSIPGSLDSGDTALMAAAVTERWANSPYTLAAERPVVQDSIPTGGSHQ